MGFPAWNEEPSNTMPGTTVSFDKTQAGYSDVDIHFDNCMCDIGRDGRLKESSYFTCLSLIASGKVDIDYRCKQECNYEYYTLLGIMMETDDMERALELLKLGADASIDLCNGQTPASIFWKKFSYSHENPELYCEVYKLVSESVKRESQESDVGDDYVYDVYMCVERNEMSEDENCLVYEDLVKQENCSLLCYTDLIYDI